MTSPVNAALDQIATQWAALTPPDRTAVRYREQPGRRQAMSGTSGDRVFELGLPVREGVIGQTGPSSTTVAWKSQATIQLSQAGRSAGALRRAVANEANLLQRNVEMTSTWPAGVIEVITGPVVPEQPDPKGDVFLTFDLQITTFETDV